jgi:hypothetical protein
MATLDDEQEYKQLEELELIGLLNFYIDKAKRLYDSSDISKELLLRIEVID